MHGCVYSSCGGPRAGEYFGRHLLRGVPILAVVRRGGAAVRLRHEVHDGGRAGADEYAPRERRVAVHGVRPALLAATVATYAHTRHVRMVLQIPLARDGSDE